jgi:hypothetical protein
MQINLRYDLRLRFSRTLATRLDAAWRQIDRMNELAVKPSWWDAFHANRMKRSFIRHRFIYRIKARIHVVFRLLAGVSEAGGVEGALIMLPFAALAWLIAGSPRPGEMLGEYDAFLLKCEIEDLQDEIQRRVNKRKRRPD